MKYVDEKSIRWLDDEVDNDQEVSSGRRGWVVESVAVDVDGEDDAADDVQQVVDRQVLRDGVVDRGRSGGGCVESGGNWSWCWQQGGRIQNVRKVYGIRLIKVTNTTSSPTSYSGHITRSHIRWVSALDGVKSVA